MTALWHQIWDVAFIVGVIGNLTASILWAVPAIRGLHKKLNRHHAELSRHVKLMRHYNPEDPYRNPGLEE